VESACQREARGSAYLRKHRHPDRLDRSHGLPSCPAADRRLPALARYATGLGHSGSGPHDALPARPEAWQDSLRAGGQQPTYPHSNRQYRSEIHVGNLRKPPKCRDWRKLHVAVNSKSGHVVASELTSKAVRDCARVPALLKQIESPLASVSADGAYDTESVYRAIFAHGAGRPAKIGIPPKRDGLLSSDPVLQERNRHIRSVEKVGRRKWQSKSGYTKRSMVENSIYRYKAIIGAEMRSRNLACQRVETRIGWKNLNPMAALGMPESYRVG